MKNLTQKFSIYRVAKWLTSIAEHCTMARRLTIWGQM